MLKIYFSLVLFLLSSTAQARSYGVGFKSFSIEDIWHQNRILPAFKPSPTHRRIWVSLWYPSSISGGPMKHMDYFAANDPFDKAYMSAYQRFRNAILHQEIQSLDQYSLIPQSPWPSAPPFFQRATGATRDASFADGSFPVIVYQTGSQGGLEENAPLFEALARQGFSVLTVIAPDTDGGIDHSKRKPELQISDIILASENLRRDPHFDFSEIVLMGYSAGAQGSLRMALRGFESKAVILLDTTMETIFKMKVPFSLLEELENAPKSFSTPILAFAALNDDGKADRFRIYRNTPHSPKVFLDFGAKMEHNDFMWHGIVARQLQNPIDQPGLKLAEERYALIQKVIIAYIEQALASKPDWKELKSVFTEAGSLVSYTALPKGVTASEPSLAMIASLRFTGEGAKALQLCESVLPTNIPDPLLCAAVALENQNERNAELFLETYYKAYPGKPNGLEELLLRSGAEGLQKQLEVQRASRRSL